MAISKTKQPKNVKVSFTDLSGTTLKVKVEWTRAQDYKDQELVYRFSHPSGTDASIAGEGMTDFISVGNSVNSKTFSINIENYCNWKWSKRKVPFLKLTVSIRGRAKTKDSRQQEVWRPWSDWSAKSIVLDEPDLAKDPGVTHDNETKVTFSFSKKKNSKAPIFGYDYFLGYITDYTGSGYPKWSTIWSPSHCGPAETSLSESIGVYPSIGHHKTVFFAIRAYGARGTGPWHYGHHVFGVPDSPTSWKFSASKTSSNALNLTYDLEYPTRKYGSVFTKAKYEYCIANPTFSKSQSASSATYRITEPSGLNYTTAIESTKKETVSITASVQTDQVIYGRIELINNDELHPRITSGRPVDSKSHRSGAVYGDLSTPTFTSITYNDNTKTVTLDGISTTSSVTESYTVVIAKSAKGNSAIIGLLEHNETTKSCKVPNSVLDGSSLSFGIQSFVADWTRVSNLETGLHIYSIGQDGTMWMASDINWKDGTVPGKPTLTLTNASTAMEGGRILVGWNRWPIGMAKLVLEYTSASDGWYDKSSINSVEIAVSDSINTQTIISGLEYASDSFSGTYYFRARYVTEGTEVYGHYSNVEQLTLHATAPPKPELRIDPTRVAVDMPFTLYWAYIAGDRSTQRACDVYEVSIENDTVTYSSTPIASADTEQRITLIPNSPELSWEAGTTHHLAIKTMSNYGVWSEMSDYKEINIADAISMNVSLGTGFSEIVDPEPDEPHIELTQFPFTISISDAAGTTASLVISEIGSMVKALPDDTDKYIFNEDVIYSSLIPIDEVTGSGSITVDKDRFSSPLMHNRVYHLDVFNEDESGQRYSYETDFIVNWDHPATIPSATIVFDDETGLVSITPIPTPEEGSDSPVSGLEEGDHCDIYRQSIDGWTRICTLGDFNETYIDQYPTLGSFGGYRIVFISKYGDDTDAIGNSAWYTYEYSEEDHVGTFQTIIDFTNNSVSLPYDLTFSRSWTKDFIETKYLGGSILGDWNSAVSHSISMNTTVAIEYDTDLYRDMHKLAMHAGICRVRTPDGTNIWANVDVKEDKEAKWVNRIAKFSLDITKVDNDTLNEVVLVE